MFWNLEHVWLRTRVETRAYRYPCKNLKAASLITWQLRVIWSRGRLLLIGFTPVTAKIAEAAFWVSFPVDSSSAVNPDAMIDKKTPNRNTNSEVVLATACTRRSGANPPRVPVRFINSLTQHPSGARPNEVPKLLAGLRGCHERRAARSLPHEGPERRGPKFLGNGKNLKINEATSNWVQSASKPERAAGRQCQGQTLPPTMATAGKFLKHAHRGQFAPIFMHQSQRCARD
jgi:hypothetical protein